MQSSGRGCVLPLGAVLHMFCRDRHPPFLLPPCCSSSGSASTCRNGVFGVEAGGVCCVTQCGRCGGVGCSSRAADFGLGADDCCIGSIMDSGMSCNDTMMEAPCIIDLGERLGLVLFIALGWSISRNTLCFIIVLFMTRCDRSYRSRCRAGEVHPSREKFDLWRLLILRVSPENSACFLFCIWLIQSLVSADVAPSRVVASTCFVEYYLRPHYFCFTLDWLLWLTV